MDLLNRITVLTTILLVYKVGLFKCDFDLKTNNTTGFIQNGVQRKERQSTQVIDLSRMYLPPKQVFGEPQSPRNGFNAPSGLGNNCGSGLLGQGKFEPTASVERSYDYASSNSANSESNGLNPNRKNSAGNSGEYSSSGASVESNFGEKINTNYNNGPSDFSGNNYNSLSNGSPQSRFSPLAGLNNGYAQNQRPEENNFGKQQSFSGPPVDVGPAYNSIDKNHRNFTKTNNSSTEGNTQRNSFDRGSSEYSTGVNGGNQGNSVGFNQSPVASNNGRDQKYREAGGSIVFPEDSQNYGKSSGGGGSSSLTDSYGQSKSSQSAIPGNGQNYGNNRWGQTSDNNPGASTNTLKAYNQQRLTASFDSNNKDQSIPQQFSKNIGSNYRNIPSSPTNVRYSQEHSTPVIGKVSGRLPNQWFNMILTSAQPSDRAADNSLRNTKKYSTLVPKDRYKNSNMPGQPSNSYEPLNNNIGSGSEASPNSFTSFVPASVLSIQISNNNSPGQGKSVSRLSNNNGGYGKPGSNSEYGEPGPNSFSNFAPGNIPNSQSSNANSQEQRKNAYGPSNNDGGGYGEPGPNSFSNFAPGNLLNGQNPSTSSLGQGKKVYGPSNNNGKPGPNSFSNFAPGNVPNSQSSDTNSIEQGKRVYGQSSSNNDGYGEPGPNSFSNFAPGNIPNSQSSNANSQEQRKNAYGPSNNDGGGYGEPGPNSFSNFAPGNLLNGQNPSTSSLGQGKKVYGPSNNNGKPGPNSFSNFAPGNVPNSQGSNTNTLEQGKNVHGPANNDVGYGEPGPNSFSNFAPGNVPNSQSSNANSLAPGKPTYGPFNNDGGYGEPGPNSFSNFAPDNVGNSQTSNDDSGYGEPGPNSFSNFAPGSLPNRPTSNTNTLQQGNNVLVAANNDAPSNSPNFQPSSSQIDCDSSELEPPGNQPSDAAFYFSSSGY
ncbi:probable cyclin-dependent serine/threonine-protein kinase DDB_G0292550 isoform X2 [Adelges cooleyi]|uniref:probable cyclin-dependent serine/threonine-protein kinase DDB_G0292550 isoform X2 n=1 Tax=Adelges cooleyi TaxID=133065 RepID=UPI00217F6BB9|nr:probable cyclin-dependent serine/threonine-protein kinase DDB_G0292550 isoform X2 [Adelges cooleyi]